MIFYPQNAEKTYLQKLCAQMRFKINTNVFLGFTFSSSQMSVNGGEAAAKNPACNSLQKVGRLRAFKVYVLPEHTGSTEDSSSC